jgi:hypothetical protein
MKSLTAAILYCSVCGKQVTVELTNSPPPEREGSFVQDYVIKRNAYEGWVYTDPPGSWMCPECYAGDPLKLAEELRKSCAFVMAFNSDPEKTRLACTLHAALDSLVAGNYIERVIYDIATAWRREGGKLDVPPKSKPC